MTQGDIWSIFAALCTILGWTFLAVGAGGVWYGHRHRNSPADKWLGYFGGGLTVALGLALTVPFYWATLFAPR